MKSTSCLSRILRAVGVIVLGFTLVLALMAINQKAALARFKIDTPAPGELLLIEGHQMHIFCTGNGSPVVMIDAGNGSFSTEWQPIQQAISKTTRVCLYDRSGYGWSQPGPQPRDGNQVVAELHALLNASQENGPFLLVGHSLGGVYVRQYAATYPADVAGLVLVETAYPLTMTAEFEQQMQSTIGFYQVMNLLVSSGAMRVIGPLSGENAMPETARALPFDLQDLYLNQLLDPNQYTTAIAEVTALPQTFAQTSQALDAASQAYKGLPVIVLTAGQTSAPGSTPFGGKRVAVAAQQIENQAQLAHQSLLGEQRLVKESGHLIHIDAPEAVISAVLDMIGQVRSR